MKKAISDTIKDLFSDDGWIYEEGYIGGEEVQDHYYNPKSGELVHINWIGWPDAETIESIFNINIDGEKD